MVDFNMMNTVAGMRNASRQGKAKKASDKMATSTSTAKPISASKEEKPLTDTSGTATGGNRGINMKQTIKQMQFGAQMAGKGKSTGLGVMAGFLGIPFTKRMGGTVMTVDTRNQEVVRPGTPLKANKNATVGGFSIAPTAAKKTTTPAGSGIDAPAPDTGWRPSGVNTAGGLMSAEMGVPLQETVGVSKRKR
jgi:hypothetical protein